MDRHADTKRSWAIGNAPPLYAHMPLAPTRSSKPRPWAPPPNPPVKTGARVCRFRGFNNPVCGYVLVAVSRDLRTDGFSWIAGGGHPSPPDLASRFLVGHGHEGN